ncbi:D-alanyl-D-alanine carboxypeptidase family protein [Paenibacillus sp. UNC499MF]|uniref:M15 family metallopeptidase n=1 Tax=Paenibacillus sp. UNC499MF TaxID=1502751 RepID=UPI0008A03117|nr:M15 family metallopeptidase [Paenibacillus sp. UNC499MF]SEF87861.1 D-alanyl-D-alanine carboxypeptidase [Paenibacillus sp. UNC499MF]
MTPKKRITRLLILASAVALFAGCENSKETGGASPAATSTPVTSAVTSPSASPSAAPGSTSKPTTSPTPSSTSKGTGTGKGTDGAEQVAAKPESMTVLVNKQFKLPDTYKPSDLVYPDVNFVFAEKIEKRMMRKEAAGALENMFDAAKKAGTPLAGVSAYRSHSTQTTLFNRYVQKDGEDAAKKYSAVPGHSEHETGLAIDVAGSTGKCAAEDCFGGTPEAKWLEDHAHEYGFIIRYPKGKESVTGYQYEPWHLRYVGIQMAKDIKAKNTTMEEYLNAVPVAK